MSDAAAFFAKKKKKKAFKFNANKLDIKKVAASIQVWVWIYDFDGLPQFVSKDWKHVWWLIWSFVSFILNWICRLYNAWASLLHDPIIRTYAYSYDVYTTCTGPFLNSFDSCCDELCYVEAECFAFLRGSWMLKLGRRSCRSWQNDNCLNLLMLDVFWAMVKMRSGHWPRFSIAFIIEETFLTFISLFPIIIGWLYHWN